MQKHFVMMDDRNHSIDDRTWECYKTLFNNLELLKKQISGIIRDYVLGSSLKLEECIKSFINEEARYILASCNVQEKPEPLEDAYSKECWVSFFAEKKASNYTVYNVALIKNNNSAITKEELEEVLLDKFCTQEVHFQWLDEQLCNKSLSWALGYLQTYITSSRDSIVLAPNDSSLENCLFNDKLIIHYGLNRKVRAKNTLMKILLALNGILTYEKTYCPSEEELVNLTGILVSKNFNPKNPNEKDLRYEVIKILCKIKGHADITGKCLENICNYFCYNKHKYNEIMFGYEMQLLNEGITPEVKACLSLAISDRLDFLKACMQLIPREKIAYEMLNDLVENKAECLMTRKQHLEEKIRSMKSKLSENSENQRKSTYHELAETQKQHTEVRIQLDYYLNKANIIESLDLNGLLLFLGEQFNDPCNCLHMLNQQTVNILIENARREISAGTSLAIIRIIVSLPKEMKLKLSVKRFLSHVPKESMEWIIKLGLEQKLVTDIDVLCDMMYEILLNYENPFNRSQAVHVLEMHKEQLSEEVIELLELERNSTSISEISGLLKRVERGRPVPQHYFHKLLPLQESSIEVLERFIESNIQKLPEFIIRELKSCISKCSNPSLVLRSLKLLLKLEHLSWSDPEIRILLINPVYTQHILQHILNSFVITEVPEILLKEIKNLPKTNYVRNFLDKMQINSVVNDITAKLKNPNATDEDKKKVIESITDIKLSDIEKILEILEDIIKCDSNLRAEAFQTLVKIIPNEYEINKILPYLDIKSLTEQVMAALKDKHCNLIPLLNEIIKNLYSTNTDHAELSSLLEMTLMTELPFKQFCLLLHFAKYSNNKQVRSRIKRFIQGTNYGKEKIVDIIQYLEFLEQFCPQNESELRTLYHCVEDGYGIPEELVCLLIDVLQSNSYPKLTRWIETILFNISQNQHMPNSACLSLLGVINDGSASNLSPEFIAFVANTCKAKLSKKALLSMFREYENSFSTLSGIANYAKVRNMPSCILDEVGELLIRPNENIETRMLAASILAHQEEIYGNLPTVITVELQQEIFKDLLCSKISEEYQILLDFLQDDQSFHNKFYQLRGLSRNQAVSAAVLWKCCINYLCSEIAEEDQYKVLLEFLQNDDKSFHEKFYVLRGLSSNKAVNNAILSNFCENDWRKEFFSYNLFIEMMQRDDEPHEFNLTAFRDNMNNLHQFLVKQNNDKTCTSEAVYEALLQKQRTFTFGLRDGINVLMMLQSNAGAMHLLFNSSDNFVQKLKYSWLSHSLQMKKIEHTSLQLDELCKYLIFKTTVMDHFFHKLKEKSSILQLIKFFQMLTESRLPLASKENFLMDGTSLLSANQWKTKLAKYLVKNMLQQKLQTFQENKKKSQFNLMEKTKKIIKKYCWTTNAPIEQSAKGIRNSGKFLAYLLLCEWSENSLFHLACNLDTEEKLAAFLRVSVIIYDYELNTGTINNKNESLCDIFKNYPAKCWEKEIHKMALYKSFKGTHIKTLPHLIKELCELNANTGLECVNEQILLNHFKAIMEKYDGYSALSADHKIRTWEADAIEDWVVKIRTDSYKADLFEMIAVTSRAVEISCRFRPWEIQLLTVLILLQTNEKNGCLAQVNTGEGKTIIIAMIAAILSLNGHTVDIVTSSPELARPQSQEMQPFFSLMGLTVAHNTEKNEKTCYKANIVYGAASNFQGDILRDEYNQLGIRCGRSCDIAIVDEVDSMLIDNRNYKVMLSSPMPAMNHLEPILALIWVFIDLAASALVEKNGLLFYRDELLQNHVTKEEFIKHCTRESIKKLISEEETGSPKIQIPKHLMRLVSEVQLNRWIDCAVFAKYGCEQDKNYIVKDNKIIPVDANNTGVVQQNMHWNDGLHQFLQIKHGLRISPENLCTNFISNVAYFKRYSKIYGLTGTLGSTNAINLLKNVYNVSNVYLPSFKKEQHLELRPIIAVNEKEYYESIVESSLSKLNNGRAVLIIAKYIAEAKKLHKMFINDFGYEKQKVKTYQTETETSIIKENIKPGEVIIATNIAGRGTDIKLVREIEQYGGLHVCVTFLPINLRTEKQNVGRTSRMGLKGTSQFVILGKHESIIEVRKERDKNEEIALQYAEHEIKRVCMHDEVFAKFCKLLEVVRNKEDSNDDIKMKALEERFALWFKLQHKHFEEGEIECIRQRFELFESGIQTETKAGKLTIENPYFRVQIGNRFLYSEKYDEAIAEYNEAIDMDPNFAENAYCNRGYAYVAKYGHCSANHKNELYAAIEDFKKAKDIIERHEQYLHILQLTHSEVTEQICLKRKIYAVQKSAIDKAIGVENEMKDKDDLPLKSKDKQNCHKGVILQALENNWNLQITHQKLQTVFKDSENIALYEKNMALSEAEIKESENNGCIGSFAIKMIKPSINWGAFIVVAITGILQIIGGIVMHCLRSPGLAFQLFAGGIEDIMHVFEHIIIKRDFDWERWGIKKAVSLVTGLVVIGFSTVRSIGTSFLSGLKTAASATVEYATANARRFWQKGIWKSDGAHTEQLNDLISGLVDCGVKRSMIPTLQDAISSGIVKPLEDVLVKLLGDECQEELARKIIEGMIGNEKIEEYAIDIAAEIILSKKCFALSGSDIKDLKCISDFVNYFILTFKTEVHFKERNLEIQGPKENNHTSKCKCKQVSEEIAAQVSAHVTMLVENHILTACITDGIEISRAGAEMQMEEMDDETMQFNEEVLGNEIKDFLQKSTAQEIVVCLSDVAEIPIRLVNEKGEWLHTVGKDKVGTSLTFNISDFEAAENNSSLFSKVARHSGMSENKLKHLVVKHLSVQNKSEPEERLMLKLYKEELQKMPRVGIKSSKFSYLCREQYNQIAYRAFAYSSLEKCSQTLDKGNFKKVTVPAKVFHWHPDFMLCFKYTTDGAKQITEASAHKVGLKNPINCKEKTCVLNIYPFERGKTNLGNF